MKTSRLITLFAVSLLAMPAIYAQKPASDSAVPSAPAPYLLMGGPGKVTSVSATPQQLPEAAQTFLRTYYSRVMVGDISHNTLKDTYKVTLGNGVKVTFNASGKVIDIESEGTDPLYEPAIKAILPEKAYKHLEQADLLSEVTGVKNAQGKGLRVILANNMPPEMLFDVDGLFIIVDY